jgi:hypothetical protein
LTRRAAAAASIRCVATTAATSMAKQAATTQRANHEQASTKACKTRHQRASGLSPRSRQQGGMGTRDFQKIKHGRNAVFLTTIEVRGNQQTFERREREEI